MRRNTSVGVALLGIGLLLAACGEEVQEVPATTTARPKRPTAAADAGVATVALTYAYNPVAKRDPFRSPTNDLSPRGDSTCPDPLCQFDLDQLTLVAVVTGDANPVAMVEDSTSRGYMVKRGTRMGRQGGKVSQILRDRLIVTEYWTSPDGKVVPKPVTLQLTEEKTALQELDLLRGKPYQP